jgi:hypothetical protein
MYTSKQAKELFDSKYPKQKISMQPDWRGITKPRRTRRHCRQAGQHSIGRYHGGYEASHFQHIGDDNPTHTPPSKKRQSLNQ